MAPPVPEGISKLPEGLVALSLGQAQILGPEAAVDPSVSPVGPILPCALPAVAL